MVADDETDSDDDEEEDDQQIQFFKVHPLSSAPHSLYQKKFLCLKRDDLEIYGNFNTNKARQLNVQLIKCKGGVLAGCKSDEEIE